VNIYISYLHLRKNVLQKSPHANQCVYGGLMDMHWAAEVRPKRRRTRSRLSRILIPRAYI